MELTGDQFEQLEQALMSAYPKQDKLKRMVRLKFERTCLQEVNWDKPLVESVDQLIEWAEAQGKIVELIRAAHQSNKTNEALKQFCAAHQPSLLSDAAGIEDFQQPVALSPPSAQETGALPSPLAIFISYRRSDSQSETARIYERLVADLGREAIFRDVDSIPLGVDFAECLDQAVGECKALLAVIGKSWVDVREKDGSRRLDNPNDFVRIEIESALKRKIPVIPLLWDGAGVPAADDLPESMRALARCNGMDVGQDPRFHDDMTRLINRLKREVLQNS